MSWSNAPRKSILEQPSIATLFSNRDFFIAFNQDTKLKSLRLEFRSIDGKGPSFLTNAGPFYFNKCLYLNTLMKGPPNWAWGLGNYVWNLWCSARHYGSEVGSQQMEAAHMTTFFFSLAASRTERICEVFAFVHGRPCAKCCAEGRVCVHCCTAAWPFAPPLHPWLPPGEQMQFPALNSLRALHNFFCSCNTIAQDYVPNMRNKAATKMRRTAVYVQKNQIHAKEMLEMLPCVRARNPYTLLCPALGCSPPWRNECLQSRTYHWRSQPSK